MKFFMNHQGFANNTGGDLTPKTMIWYWNKIFYYFFYSKVYILYIK